MTEWETAGLVAACVGFVFWVINTVRINYIVGKFQRWMHEWEDDQIRYTIRTNNGGRFYWHAYRMIGQRGYWDYRTKTIGEGWVDTFEEAQQAIVQSAEEALFKIKPPTEMEGYVQ
jgi:hypothetical protein